MLRTLTGAARTFLCQEAPTRPAVVSQMGSKGSSSAPSGVAGKSIKWSGRRRAPKCENRVCIFQQQLEETLSVKAGRDCRIIFIRWHKQIGVGRESCIGVLKGLLKLNGEGPAREHGMLSQSGMRGVEGAPGRRSLDPGWRAIAWRRRYDFCEVAALGGDDGGDVKESAFAGAFLWPGAFFCNNRRFGDLPVDATRVFPMSLARASAEESPRVSAEISECAPGVSLLSGAKLSFRVSNTGSLAGART